jgi:hypothetical protein
MFIKEGARISKGCNRIVEEVEELLRYAPTCTQLEELGASEVDIAWRHTRASAGSEDVTRYAMHFRE